MSRPRVPVIKSIDEPLTREEQDDLFRQMRLHLAANKGIVCDKYFLACEHENMYRMMATILQQRATIGGGDTAIKQLEMEANAYRLDRDAAHHVIVEAGIVPVRDTHCDCDDCKSVLEGMQKAGYAKI